METAKNTHNDFVIVKASVTKKFSQTRMKKNTLVNEMPVKFCFGHSNDQFVCNPYNVVTLAL